MPLHKLVSRKGKRRLPLTSSDDDDDDQPRPTAGGARGDHYKISLLHPALFALLPGGGGGGSSYLPPRLPPPVYSRAREICYSLLGGVESEGGAAASPTANL